MKKYIFLLVAGIMLCAMQIPGGAAYVIKGTVTDTNAKPLADVRVEEQSTNNFVYTDAKGKYQLKVTDRSLLHFSKTGYTTLKLIPARQQELNVIMTAGKESLDSLYNLNDVVEEKEIVFDKKRRKEMVARSMQAYESVQSVASPSRVYSPVPQNTESYTTIQESGFKMAEKDPLSTFSIDVDAANYSTIRRFLNNGQLPPVSAVRIEEMVNYFSYDYPQPRGNQPFSVTMEAGAAPWNTKHKLVHIGVQGKKIATDNLPPSNLVFLLDVSGSMNAANKLPLLKSAMKLLVTQLRAQDKVSIVVYAGAAGTVLEPTPGNQANKILEAMERLQAGGSTAGGAGIELAYATAVKNFVKGGNNRVILATDGDFNVGASGNKAMEELIEEKRRSGVYLTVLGFGMGNYKDDKMEILADKGNGNYAYIDNIQEAKKVLVNEFGGTLFTIAKDVKIQVEFNPANVTAYRLIGYESRRLNNEDFNNDKKDAGELGAGHTVTAVYEIVPAGVESSFASVDPLRYQQEKNKIKPTFSDELMTVKLRYKEPQGDDKSKLITATVKKNEINNEATTENYRWSSAVITFGMFLSGSDYVNDYKAEELIRLAKQARGTDAEGYRAECIRMMESYALLAYHK